MSAEPIPRAFRKCPTYTKLVDTYTSLCTNKYGICRIAPSEKNAKIVCFQSCHEHTECELLRLSAISQIVASYRQHGAQCSNNHSWILAIFAEAIPDLIDTIVTCSSTVAADAAARAFRTLPWTSDATSKISLCLQDKPERETPQIARAMLSVVHPMISRGLFSCYVDHADSRDHSSDTSAAKPSSICCHTCTETVLLGSHSRGTVGVDGHRRGPTSESKAADVVTWVRLAMPWWTALLQNMRKKHNGMSADDKYTTHSFSETMVEVVGNEKLFEHLVNVPASLKEQILATLHQQQDMCSAVVTSPSEPWFVRLAALRVISASVRMQFDREAVASVSAVLVGAVTSADLQAYVAPGDANGIKFSSFAERSYHLVIFRSIVHAVCKTLELFSAYGTTAKNKEAATDVPAINCPYHCTAPAGKTGSCALSDIVTLVLGIEKALVSSPVRGDRLGRGATASSDVCEQKTHNCDELRQCQAARAAQMQAVFFRIFEEQDDLLVEMLSVLLQAELHCNACSRESAEAAAAAGSATSALEPMNAVAACDHVTPLDLTNARCFAQAFRSHDLFALFLDRVSFDHLVVVDFLMGNETDFLAYFLAYLRHLCTDLRKALLPPWMTPGHVMYAKFNTAVVQFFDALLKSLHGFNVKKLFPYNVAPLIRRITVVEHLIGQKSVRSATLALTLVDGYDST
eukprot:m.863664 g.863664  ORF g.863664 m.863664 type:complete len:688 (+) comp23545_c0_seq7:470-2533(+)